MLATARRAPPRNPDPQVPQTYAPATAVAIPWGQIILTTAITTVTGYVVIEVIRMLHQSVVRRRHAKADADLAAAASRPALPNAGLQPNGSFVMPRPEHFVAVGAPNNPYAWGNIAANANTYRAPVAPPQPQAPQPPPTQQGPNLYDVAAPVNRHEFYSHQRSIDDRLARMEAMLARSYADADGEEVA